MKKTVRSQSVQSLFEWTLVMVGVVVLVIFTQYEITGDGAVRFRALQTLSDTGHREPMPYSYLAPLGAYPLYWLGKSIDKAQHGMWWWAGEQTYQQNAAFELTSHYNVLIWLAGVAVMGWALRDAISDKARRRFLLLLLAGTLACNHVRNFYGEIFTAVLVGVGLAVVYLRNNRWGWFLLPVGVANTPASLIGLCFVTLRTLWESRKLRYLLVPVSALLLYMMEAWFRMGALGLTGYEGNRGFHTILPYSGLTGFSYPVFFGLLGLLLSFGKGLAFYAPGCLLPAQLHLVGDEHAALRSCYIQWMLFLAGLVLLYSKWWAWYGGWTFGPRFLLFASFPSSLALALYLESPSTKPMLNLTVLGILALSLWVGICGSVFDQDKLPDVGMTNNYAMEHLVWYAPEFSALWHPFIEHRRLNWHDVLVIAYASLLFPVLGGSHIVSVIKCIKKNIVHLAPRLCDWSAWRL